MPSAPFGLRKHFALACVPRDFAWKGTTSLLGETCAEVSYREKGKVVYRALAPYASTPTAIAQNLPLGSTARVVGRLAALLERWDEAEQHFKTALAANDRMGFHGWTAWTRLNYGDMLLRRNHPGDRDRALALLQQAHDFAKDSGMGKVERDSERLLASLT